MKRNIADMRLIHKTRKATSEVIYLSDVEGKLEKKEALFDRIQNTIGEVHDEQVFSMA